MIVVTGGAGFIGSALVWALNKRGRQDIFIVDDIDSPEKQRNVAPLLYQGNVAIQDFRQGLASGAYKDADIEAVFHLGACSSTTETDWEYLSDINVAYTKELILWCVAQRIRLIYASSAAVYGNGTNGYSDAHELFDVLEPLNLYGKSKLEVDLWARDNGYLKEIVGLRYFNVFGPNEQHKGDMRSVIAKKYADIVNGQEVTLFRSYNPAYGDGEQVRDFIYVKDAVAMTLFFFDSRDSNGVFNVGTGETHTWNEVMRTMFQALGAPENIRYVDMPESLRAQYQYLTKADMTKMRAVGWKGMLTPFTNAITEYVQTYLVPNKRLGEEVA